MPSALSLECKIVEIKVTGGDHRIVHGSRLGAFDVESHAFLPPLVVGKQIEVSKELTDFVKTMKITTPDCMTGGCCSLQEEVIFASKDKVQQI